MHFTERYFTSLLYQAGDNIMDLTRLDLPTLTQLQQKLNKEINKRKSQEKKRMIERFQHEASEYGFTLHELFGEDVIDLNVKYRHPDDPKFTWSGRGRKPRWIVDWEKSGGTLSQLAV
jgi:DNA-binding protein H-NS